MDICSKFNRNIELELSMRFVFYVSNTFKSLQNMTFATFPYCYLIRFRLYVHQELQSFSLRSNVVEPSTLGVLESTTVWSPKTEIHGLQFSVWLKKKLFLSKFIEFYLKRINVEHLLKYRQYNHELLPLHP